MLVNSKSHVVIHGWMVNELQLKGNDLLVYATIYGFSQADDQYFKGSLQYLADWASSTKQGIQKNLKNLMDKGLIEKKEVYVNGIKFCQYRSCTVYNSVAQGMQLSSPGGIQLSCTNNIDINNIDNNIDYLSIKKNTKKKESFISVIEDYTKDDDLRDSLNSFVEMRKKMKGFTIRALKLNLKKLDEIAIDDYTKVAVVNQSVEKGWKSFYALKAKREELPF